MKNIVMILLFFSSLYSVNIDKIFENIDEVKIIQEKKKATKERVKYDPFSNIKKEEKREEKKKVVKVEKPKKRKKIIYQPIIELEAIFGKSAFINGKWYRVGDKIGKYKIIKIGRDSVSLKIGRRVKSLRLIDKERKFLKIRGAK